MYIILKQMETSVYGTLATLVMRTIRGGVKYNFFMILNGHENIDPIIFQN